MSAALLVRIRVLGPPTAVATIAEQLRSTLAVAEESRDYPGRDGSDAVRRYLSVLIEPGRKRATMGEHGLSIKGWLVAQSEAEERWSSYSSTLYRRHLLLFRTATDWSLLTVYRHTRWGDDELPSEGAASVSVETHPDLMTLKAAMVKSGWEQAWCDLVKAGAESTLDADRDLTALWTPVRIDRELEHSSVHRSELGQRGELRRREDWREVALVLAVERLRELGFIVLDSSTDHRQVFRRGLPKEWAEWGNPIVGAVVAARHGYRADLVVAIDGAGEVYVRTADGNRFDPGAPRRFAPRPLTDREWKQVEEIGQQIRAARRDFEERRRQGAEEQGQ